MNQGGHLEIRSLHAWYDASHVLQGVDLTLPAGEILAVLGRNGSGRSTLARAVLGLVEHEGEIRLGDTALAGLPTHARARCGLGYVPETRDIFPALTVAQNLALGMKKRRPGKWRVQDMYDMFPILGDRASTPAQALSGGEQQMLALCRTLMGDPVCMIVDEPTEGLAPRIVQQIADFLEVLRRSGTSVLLIDQRQDIALQISDRVAVLGHGKIVFHGTPDALRAAPAVSRTWIEI